MRIVSMYVARMRSHEYVEARDCMRERRMPAGEASLPFLVTAKRRRKRKERGTRSRERERALEMDRGNALPLASIFLLYALTPRPSTALLPYPLPHPFTPLPPPFKPPALLSSPPHSTPRFGSINKILDGGMTRYNPRKTRETDCWSPRLGR